LTQADSHVPGVAAPWFHVLGWGASQPVPLQPADFYSDARYPSGAGVVWDGELTQHWAWDWRDSCVRSGTAASCPGAFVAAGNGGLAIPAKPEGSDAGEEETFLQLAVSVRTAFLAACTPQARCPPDTKPHQTLR
jgi:hypothetical protein